MTLDNIYHVIKDPVHGTMQFTSLEDSWIKPFIDSAPFQRLRHIKQLGMGDFIFPGAVHTRFNHSLGCSYIASQIAHKIGLSEEERQLVIIACLLHDIGHGPFSHTFEDLFHQKLIRHEDWTPFFLAEYRNNHFFHDYNRLNPRHHLTDEKFQLIEDMIMHRAHTKQVLADIVSSQLDADRLDYLLRDSHFCGVTYGEFDFRWMLHCMTIVNAPHSERLGITHKGIGVVEHYLMARRLMIRNIYYHQKKLAIEFFLVSLLKTLSENLTDPLYAEINDSRLGQFLSAVHTFNQQVKTKKNSDGLKQAFLETYYPLYRQLSDYDVFLAIRLLSEKPSDTPTWQMANRLQNRLMPKILRLDPSELTTVERELTDFKNKHKKDLAPWQLTLIKTPLQSYSAEEDAILVENEQGRVTSINEISVMINAISDKREQIAFLCIDQPLMQQSSVLNFIKLLTEDTKLRV